MLGEPAAKKVAQVPLSDHTIHRRIEDLAHDMEDQLIEQIKTSKYFALQLDESTDVANLAILMVYVRFQYKDDLKEEYFFSSSLPTNTTSSEVFKALREYIVDKCELDFKFCVGVCSDGAAAMTGRRSGVVTQIKALAPECKSTHCFIHRESLATKKMSTELNSVLSEVVKIVNHVKANALNSRLFAALCDGMGAEPKQLLLHTDASVHRPRHNVGASSAARRYGQPKGHGAATTTAGGGHQQHQSYHQYQQQRKLQQQLQQQHYQQQQQQSIGNENSSAAQKLAKTSRNWNEQQQQQQQILRQQAQAPAQYQQQQSHTNTGDTAAKQSIAVVGMPQSLVAGGHAAGHGRPAMQQINANIELQRDLSPAKTSRIPLQQQQQQQTNFNQISKTATNLLNDIYEHHLLSQTTFQVDGTQERQQQRPNWQQKQQLQQQRFLAARQVGQEVELNFASSSSQQQRSQPQQNQSQQRTQQWPRHFRSAANQQQQPFDSSHEDVDRLSSAATFVPIHGGPNQQHVAQKPVHFLKLPPPPPPPPAPPTNQPGVKQESIHSTELGGYLSYQQHFQFSDAYVEPVDSRQHFLLQSDAAANPPPPPAPLNHVYETIKERPPLPPPKNLRKSGAEDVAPPLPPSRQLKKRLLAAKAGGNKRAATATTNNSHSKLDAGQLGGKLNSKLLPMQPPAYVAPPAAATKQVIQQQQQQQQQQHQYNPQQRTKADGEQRPYLYQQLRERQQQQQQQQQSRSEHIQVREHPLGAHADQHGAQQQQQQKTQKAAEIMITQPAVALTTTKATIHATAATVSTQVLSSSTTSNSQPTTCGISAIDVSDSSVELLLQAGLLKSSHATSLTAMHSNSGINKSAHATNNNNAKHNGGNANNNNLPTTSHHQRPTALPIVFEEDTGEFQDVLVLEEDGTAKLPYRHGKIEVRFETAQAMAAAAYYARIKSKNDSTREFMFELLYHDLAQSNDNFGQPSSHLG
ncbi:transcription factor 20-like [Rhagoletis pomonella]|uniref:transcription factor 20-like n=1 Tax=Rhagoletis pomonella TaxID=28610 RepID=UPI0017857C07|nr:transcription factor 20-like [Rhagoletis pomonella]